MEYLYSSIMKLTIKQLRKIIKEELEESFFDKPMSQKQKEEEKEKLEDLSSDLPDISPLFLKRKK